MLLLCLLQVAVAIYALSQPFKVVKMCNKRLRRLGQLGRPVSQVGRVENLPPAIPSPDPKWEAIPIMDPSFNLGPFPNGESAVRFESEFVQAFMQRLIHQGYEDTRIWRGTAVLVRQDNKKVTLGQTLPAVIFGRSLPNGTSFYAAYAFDRSGRNIVVHRQCVSLFEKHFVFGGFGGFLQAAFYLTLFVGLSAMPLFGGIIAFWLLLDKEKIDVECIAKHTADWRKESGFEQHQPLHEAFQNIQNEILMEANEQFIV